MGEEGLGADQDLVVDGFVVAVDQDVEEERAKLLKTLLEA